MSCFRRCILCLLLPGALTACVLGAAPATQPATLPTTAPTTMPATVPAVPVSAPTLVSIRMKDASPQAIFAELGRQGGCVFLTNPEGLFQRQLPPVSIDIEKQPFWEAARQICFKTGLFPTLVDRRKFTLSANSHGWMDGPLKVEGSFLILAVQAARNSSVHFGDGNPRKHEMQVQLAVLPEPKLRVLKATKNLKIDQAIDEKGIALSPVGQGTEVLVSGGPFAWTLEAKLRFPGNAGQRIATLKGTARYAIQKAADPWLVRQILATKNATKTIAQRSFTVAEVKKVDDYYSLRVVVTSTGSQKDVEAIQQLMHPADVQLLDAQQRPLVFKAWTRAVEQQQVEYVFQFIRAPEGPAPAADEPATLTWDMPTELEEVTIPVEFHDLPMP